MKTVGQGTETERSEAGAKVRSLIVTTLSIKQRRELLNLSGDAFKHMDCGALRTDISVMFEKWSLLASLTVFW